MLKYDIYFKVEAFSKVLQDFLSSAHQSESEFIKIRERLLSTLDLVKNSNTLDYEVEGSLIEKFYSFTYAFIKFEMEVFGCSVTLNELKKNEIHELNLDKQIVKELETFDFNDKRVSLVAIEKNKIDASGMNATYVQEDFIKSIIGTPKSEEEIYEKVDTLSIKMDEYYQKIDKIKEKAMAIKTLQAKLKEDSACVKSYIRKDIALFCTSFGLIVSFLTASICGGLALGKEKVYKQIVHTYTTDNGLETEEKEVTEITNRVTLYEYTPYEKNLLNDRFHREATSYDLGMSRDLELEEYLQLDLGSLADIGKTVTQSKQNLSLEDLYQSTYCKVEEIITLEDSMYNRLDKGSFILLLVFSLIILGLIDYHIEAEMQDKGFNPSDSPVGYGFLVGVKELFSDYKRLKETKQNCISYEDDLQKLYLDAKNLWDMYGTHVRELEQFLPFIENNAEYVEKIEAYKKHFASMTEDDCIRMLHLEKR